jgi:hypothetical protein
MLLNKQDASAPDAPVNSWLGSWTKHLKAGHKENHREGIERIKPGLNLLSTDPYLVGVWVSSLYTTVIYTSTYSYTVCCDQSNGKPLT